MLKDITTKTGKNRINKKPGRGEDSFIRSALCGGLAGIGAGVMITVPEYMKVTIQVEGGSLLNIIQSKSFWKKIPRASIPYLCCFSTVCSLEFSINETIKHYNKYAGLFMSGFTGAFFLVAAEHLMLRSHHQQKLLSSLRELAGRGLFTGFSPMMVRESLFIANVVYLGPYAGQFFK